MEIRELWLKNYGKFEDHRIRLKPGINIIYGGNETGKTTVHSFIRAMFFGLSRARGRAARTDEFKLRCPWDTPGAFRGSMRVMDGGELYRIDRSFDRGEPPLLVTCETSPEEKKDPEGFLSELLGGVSEAAFLNTLFISQARCETDEALAQELRRYMVNSGGAMDAGLDVTQALQKLRRQKKALEQKRKNEEAALEAEIEKKLAKAEALRDEITFLEKQAARYDRSAGKNPGGYEEGYDRSAGKYPGGYTGRAQEDGEEWENADGELEEWDDAGAGRGRIILQGLLVLAGILALLGAAFLDDWKMRVFLGIFGVVFFLLLIPFHMLLGGPRQEEEESGEYGDERTGAEAENYEELMEELGERRDAYQGLQDELEKLYAGSVRPEGTDTEIAALTLAIDRICELSSGLYERMGGGLNERASTILKELTDGAYSRIVLDETMEIRIHTPSRVLGLYQVSGGTMQQIYFALRMAAAEILEDGKKLPVVLDETFAMYDDSRLEAALRWLKKSGRQVILFTCQKREHEILEQLGREQPGT